MVESSGRHRVNHEFLDMVDTAGELNACPGGHRFVPVQNRQLVLPGVFGDQKPGLARGSILSADRTQRGSFTRNLSILLETFSLSTVSGSDARQAWEYSYPEAEL